MYSEENERLSEAAYNLFRKSDPTLPEWVSYYPKHLFRDLVQTFQANPRSHISIANAMEQAVSDVLKAEGSPQTEAVKDGINSPPFDTLPEPEVKPEPKQKPAKAKDKK